MVPSECGGRNVRQLETILVMFQSAFFTPYHRVRKGHVAEVPFSLLELIRLLRRQHDVVETNGIGAASRIFSGDGKGEGVIS
jgi:hypothetical protein